MWDGKDENGLPLPDGTYRYTLVVHDAEGRVITSPTKTVEISTGGPQGSVPVIPIQP
jgi:flagellar hook assembly protein FlgD